MITPTLEELRERVGCPVIYIGRKGEAVRVRLVKLLPPPAPGKAPGAMIELEDDAGFMYEAHVAVHALRLVGGTDMAPRLSEARGYAPPFNPSVWPRWWVRRVTTRPDIAFEVLVVTGSRRREPGRGWDGDALLAVHDPTHPRVKQTRLPVDYVVRHFLPADPPEWFDPEDARWTGTRPAAP